MSIITTAQAVPSRLFSIYASLFGSPSGESKERLEAWATPPSLSVRGGGDEGASTTLFSNTLQEARKLGLVEERDGSLRLASDAMGQKRKHTDPEANFRDYMLRTLFDPTRATASQQDGFMWAMAWFLSTNPLEPLNFSEPPQNRLTAEIGDHASLTELTNLNTYQNFLYWARYLGFATIVGGRDDDHKSRRVLADPIRAIVHVLAEIFRQDRELSVDVFISRLSAIFPVFEGGTVRQQYETMRLKPIPDGGQRLSIAISLALQRLADRQIIALTVAADAPSRILDFGVDEGRVTHIGRKGVA
jgi:hypothetical protein